MNSHTRYITSENHESYSKTKTSHRIISFKQYDVIVRY